MLEQNLTSSRKILSLLRIETGGAALVRSVERNTAHCGGKSDGLFLCYKALCAPSLAAAVAALQLCPEGGGEGRAAFQLRHLPALS